MTYKYRVIVILQKNGENRYKYIDYFKYLKNAYRAFKMLENFLTYLKKIEVIDNYELSLDILK